MCMLLCEGGSGSFNLAINPFRDPKKWFFSILITQKRIKPNIKLTLNVICGTTISVIKISLVSTTHGVCLRSISWRRENWLTTKTNYASELATI